MCRIVLTFMVFVAVDNPTTAAQDEVANTKANGYEVRFTPGPKGDPLEAPEVKIAYTATGRVATIALESDIDSVDKVFYAGDRCIILASLMSNTGRSAYVVDAKAAKIVASAWCFRPVVSPKENRVVFEKWNPKLAPNEQIWPAVLVLSAPHAESGPVQVYPYEESNPADVGGDRHSVVSPKSWNSDGDALAFFDKFGDYAGWESPYELYVVLVRFKDGKPLRAKRSLVDVGSFVRGGADTDPVAFYAETLQIVNGKLRGKLYSQSYWMRDTFSFDLAQIDKERPLGIDDIKDDAAAAEKK